MPMCLQWITSPQRKERKQTMNFIQVKNFLSNYIHTVLLLLGLVCVLVAITLLTNVYYGLLALGIVLIGVAVMLNTEQKEVKRWHFKARQNTTGDPFLQHVVSIQSDDYTTSFTSVRALRNSDVFAAVRIIASDIASSPIQLVKTICHKLIMNW